MLVGLGNPGREYEKTRHNVGFRASDLVARALGVKIDRLKFQALTRQADYKGHRILLVQPQTYMNLSGAAVSALASYYKIPPARILVMFDDISLPLGRIRLRAEGSAGGHNGVKSIIQSLGSDQFPRVKIGVGAPQKGEEDLKDFVLDTVDSDAYEGIKRAPEAALTLIFQGVDAAMQAFNGAPPAPKE